MQSWLLALLLTCSLIEAACADGEQALAPCDEVASHVRSVASDGRAFERAPGQDYDDYRALLAPVVRLSRPELANGDLSAKARRFLGGDFGEVFEVQHVSGRVWRAFQVAGTAHCQTERFFSLRPDGSLSAVDTPATFGDLCWRSDRQIGRVSGRPALIEQEVLEHPNLGVDVEITPWRGGKRETCRVAIRFKDAFHVTEKFCKGPSVCRTAQPLAVKLADALARAEDGTRLATVAAPPPQQAQALAAWLIKAKQNFEGAEFGYTELPAFGAKPRTKYPTYAGSPQATLIALSGHTLIARVGIGGVGWRELGDYLVTLYNIEGEDLEPVASFVVQRQNTGLRSVTTSVPDSQRKVR